MFLVYHLVITYVHAHSQAENLPQIALNLFKSPAQDLELENDTNKYGSGSRQTELAEEFPGHVVCKWMTDEHYARASADADGGDEKALQKALRHVHESSRVGSQRGKDTKQNRPDLPSDAASCEFVQESDIPPRGVEPLSSG
jgi:hypothetical protein